MIDDAVIDVMEVLHKCRCCLRRPPDKDLTKPYSHLGKIEIYSDIIAQCFDIRLSLDNDNECGICNSCVDRLRDASDFKIQVHSSQAELDRLLSAMNDTETKYEIVANDNLVSNDVPEIKSEIDENIVEKRDIILYVGPAGESAVVEQEVANDDITFNVGPAGESAVVKEEVANVDIILMPLDGAAVAEVKPAQSVSVRATEQLATACSIKLETPLKTTSHPDNYYRDFEGEQESLFVHNYVEKKTFFCRVCEKRFEYEKSLKIHMRLHKADKHYSCDICKKQFIEKRILKQHIFRIHMEHYECKFCKKQLFYKSTLIRHMAQHKEDKPHSKVSMKQFPQDSDVHGLTGDEKNRYFCDLCKKGSLSKSALIRHMRVHTGQKPYSCEVCNKRFAYKPSLNVHLTSHSSERPYSCQVCKKTFKHEKYVKIHMRTHTGEKPHECYICNKRYARKTALNSHLGIHSTEGHSYRTRASFCCEKCGKQLTSKRGLISHIKRHMDVDKASCEICNKQFTSKHNLLSHMTIHTGDPHSCDICKKQFRLKSRMREHMMIHDELKPHCCHVCARQFKHKSALTVHIRRLHSNERPHVCDVCGKAFALLSSLKQHYRCHTKVKPYACKLCSKKFSLHGTVRKHLIKVHKQQGEGAGRGRFRFNYDVIK